MKNITLTFNEALVLIAEGMTMNNVKTLANKLRNANAPTPVAASDSNLQIAQAEAGTWEAAYHAAMVDLDKAKQTEITLRDDILKLSEACAHVNQENYEQTERANRMESKIRDLENDAKQDDESLKYFRKWVEELRVVLDCDKGLTTAAVFSDAVSCVKEYKTTAELLKKTEGQLEKANNVIGAVKLLCDHRGYDMQLHDIKNNVENYYRGN